MCRDESLVNGRENELVTNTADEEMNAEHPTNQAKGFYFYHMLLSGLADRKKALRWLVLCPL